MVHKDWIRSENGTLVSHSGTLVHVGQTFFPESWNDHVFETSPYSLNTNKRTLNSEDGSLPQASAGGYNAFTRLQYLNGDDFSDGLVGYLTIGVDPRSTYKIGNDNYNGRAKKRQAPVDDNGHS